MKRRAFIQIISTGLAACLLPLRVFATAWQANAFNATSVNAALQDLNLGVASPVASQAISIIAPDKAENGAIVQVEIDSQLPNSQAIAILVDKNPTALIGYFELGAGAQGKLITRIKMAETSEVLVVVRADGKLYSATKRVQVMENGCGGGGAHERFEPSMKMRAKLTHQLTEVKAIIVHPMHTGRGKDDFDQLIAAQFIQTADVLLNGAPVLQMQWGTGIAKNPYLTFYLNNAKVGDTISLTWQDNLDKQFSGSTQVVAS